MFRSTGSWYQGRCRGSQPRALSALNSPRSLSLSAAHRGQSPVPYLSGEQSHTASASSLGLSSTAALAPKCHFLPGVTRSRPPPKAAILRGPRPGQGWLLPGLHALHPPPQSSDNPVFKPKGEERPAPCSRPAGCQEACRPYPRAWAVGSLRSSKGTACGYSTDRPPAVPSNPTHTHTHTLSCTAATVACPQDDSPSLGNLNALSLEARVLRLPPPRPETGPGAAAPPPCLSDRGPVLQPSPS